MSNLIYPSRIIHFVHNHGLELTASNQVGPNSLCAKCKQRNAISVSGSIPPSSDFYVCRSCDYFIHVPCIQVPSNLIKYAAPPNNMPHNSGLAASSTVGVQQNPRQMPPGLGKQVRNAMVFAVASTATMTVAKAVMEKVGHDVKGDAGDSGSGLSANGANVGGGEGGCAVITEDGGGYFVSDVGEGDCAVITEDGGGYFVSDGGSVGTGNGDFAVITEGGGGYFVSDGGDISGLSTDSTVIEGAGGIDASDVIDGASSWIEGLVGLLIG